MRFTFRASAFASALAAAVSFASVSLAQSPVVVVELFTSQGCSSCPPADEILTELASQDDVIALGEHVHYWDYLGWKDDFAQERFATRQEYLNMNIPSKYRRVTPQMIFNGQSQVAGARLSQIKQKIREIRAQKAQAALDLAKDGNVVTLKIKGLTNRLKPSDIHLVHYLKQAIVPIERGENRGRTLKYTNIVSSWETIGQWNGKSSKSMTFKLSKDLPFAVLVQAKDYGPIYIAQAAD
jgi:hypothetical protein